ncbi:MAG TPA: GTP cyclohydrolase II [Rhizomicrobium sp.]|jgi:GTP cyclohydrolase II|nr:GTP cyclohydrolase II [Rhizomicrobium sp.]
MARRSISKKRKVKRAVPAAAADARSAVSKVARAAAALRQGKPVLIKDGRARPLLAFAVETATDKSLKALGTEPRLLITHARARTLKIRLYTPDVVALPLKKPTAHQLKVIADPTADLSEPLKGPFAVLRETLPRAAAASVKLAKLAGLLPATIVATPRAPKTAVTIDVADIENYESESVRTLKILTRARVPLGGAESSELVAFRAQDGGPEHYAIVIDAPPTNAPVLTRIHSECFTGDLLGSLKCDCGPQLRGAIEKIEQSGGGILLYLAQEGRGIGLVNKLRAYRMQDQGFDTIEANERLGFEPDERLYGVAARMLSLLGYKSVRLLTNNPDKVAALKAAGIAVAERVSHAFPDNPHNRHYLETKKKAGHLL